MKIQVRLDDFDVGREIAQMRQDLSDTGAIVNFTGVVSDRNDSRTIFALELEHYPGMTEDRLEDIARQACERWQLSDVLVIHRIGRLFPGEQIVLVAVCVRHRRQAFAGCEFIVDFLKTSAPFWKRETTPEGSHWVAARAEDDSALQKWI